MNDLFVYMFLCIDRYAPSILRETIKVEKWQSLSNNQAAMKDLSSYSINSTIKCECLNTLNNLEQNNIVALHEVLDGVQNL